MAYYAIQTSSGELYHHGILGQKWGRRNGPPYPLGASDHSSAEKKAGWRKSLSKANSDYVRATKEKTDKFRSTRNELLKERKEIRNTAKAFKRDTKEKLKANTKKLIDNSNEFENNHPSEKYKQDLKNVAKEAKNSINKETVKKAAKIGAAVAVTGLAAYGTYKLYGAAMSERYKMSPVKLRKMGIDVPRLSTPYSKTVTWDKMGTPKSGSTNKQRLQDVYDMQNRFRSGKFNSSEGDKYDKFKLSVARGEQSALAIFDALDSFKLNGHGDSSISEAHMSSEMVLNLILSNSDNKLVSKGYHYGRN